MKYRQSTGHQCIGFLGPLHTDWVSPSQHLKNRLPPQILFNIKGLFWGFSMKSAKQIISGFYPAVMFWCHWTGLAEKPETEMVK